MIWLIIIAIIAILLIWGIVTYNKFIRFRENINNAMSQISAQIESRWDALTNLITATKNYQTYESKTLTKIIEDRSNISQDASVKDIDQDDQHFSNALGVISALAEQYPDLKASNVYLQTMSSVDKYENQVRESRMIYNDTVTRFNRAIKTFPNSLLASPLGFTEQNTSKILKVNRRCRNGQNKINCEMARNINYHFHRALRFFNRQ